MFLPMNINIKFICMLMRRRQIFSMRFVFAAFLIQLVLSNNVYAAPIHDFALTANDISVPESALLTVPVTDAQSLEVDRTVLSVSADTPSSVDSRSRCQWKDCNQVLNHTTDLIQHVETVHIGNGKSLYECHWLDCNCKSKNRNIVIRHFQSHSGQKTYRCSFEGCGKFFSRNEPLQGHLLTHSNGIQGNWQQTTVTAHVNMSCSLSPVQLGSSLQCHWKDCNRMLSDLNELIQHVHLTHFGNRKSHYDCHWLDCSFRAKSRYNIIIHFRNHSGEKPFACSYQGCTLRFKQLVHLNNHIETHDPTRIRISCPLRRCAKQFIIFENFRQHLTLRNNDLSKENRKLILSSVKKNVPFPNDLILQVPSKEQIIHSSDESAMLHSKRPIEFENDEEDCNKKSKTDQLLDETDHVTDFIELSLCNNESDKQNEDHLDQLDFHQNKGHELVEAFQNNIDNFDTCSNFDDNNFQPILISEQHFQDFERLFNSNRASTENIGFLDWFNAEILPNFVTGTDPIE